MDRRNFFKIAGISPFALNGFSLRPFSSSRLARMVAGCEDVEERILVLVQLKGGNDGLNTLIPLNNYDRYAQLRPSIRVPETGTGAAITLDNSLPAARQVGLHPSMVGVKALYDQGMAHIVQAVGYENMNQSHFKGTDLWLTGGDTSAANNNLGSGWMGRALTSIYPSYQGVPTTALPDPLGIQLGDPNPSLGYHTETEHQVSLNLSGQDPSGFYSLIQTIGGKPLTNVPASEYGDEIAYIQQVEQSVNLYAQRVTSVFNAGTNAGSYPDNAFANQLKTVARLVSGGCKTKIYLTTLGGFDTHSAQVFANGNAVDGLHSQLLTTLSEGIKAFYDDLEGLNLADKITTVSFSEFGRCARENGSNGTDHGTLAPMLVFGKAIQPGVSGNNVDLNNLTSDFQLQNAQFDYRQVFATVLQDYLGASNQVLDETYFDAFPKMPIFQANYVVPPDCYLGTTAWYDLPEKASPLQISPNPASWFAEARFRAVAGFDGQFTITDISGRVLSRQQIQVQGGRENIFLLNIDALKSGNYIVRLEGNGVRPVVGKLVVVK